ncbi:protein-L-isoaspartate(D-aspartate) O-methyltransferase [Algiphilus sp. W345]|uniref:Protein-L-isoaspartate O-methyltransferase n=1 Tax=Banduia mediterranea TaxID=3075609 RepID=A0ABU2WQ08_9GAMM|nr:protein-L-isoaspartate(D-aspartate) O-methyltransferase [Algiphilus sp. W345]MDT0499152.1 protein-L-isoaspartate(D-aspartate) O-methyltransferase [Algiphilus sp. W345]
MIGRHHHSRGLGVTSDNARQRLVRELQQQGVTDPAVLEVIARVPRHEFVEEALRYRAYINTALPIGQAQTISQPYVVALMTQLLMAPGKIRKVLEIGTGSGYQTAVLAELVSTVFSVERLRELSRVARERLERLGYHNVLFNYGDGMKGWASQAPYDGILVTAGAAEVPPALPEQLGPGGRLVMPVGPSGAQVLLCIDRTLDGRLIRSQTANVSFVPLLAGRA